MDNPDVQANFEKMIADTVIQLLSLIELNVTNCAQELDTMQTNYLELQEQYGKAYTSVLQQAQKANSDMLENMEQSFNALKDHMRQLCDNTVTKTNDLFIMCLETLKTQCEDTLKKHPNLSSKLYQDTMKNLKEIQTTEITRGHAIYSSMVANWDDNYEQTVKQLKFPAIKEPAFPKNEQRSSITPVEFSAPAANSANKKLAAPGTSQQQACCRCPRKKSTSTSKEVKK